MQPAIFIIDFTDNYHVRNICALFESQHYDISIIKTADQLKQLAVKQRPDYFILEYGQRDEAGEDIVQQIKSNANLKDVPILAYSYSGHEDFKEAGLRAGVNKFLAVPERYEDFLVAVREMELDSKDK